MPLCTQIGACGLDAKTLTPNQLCFPARVPGPWLDRSPVLVLIDNWDCVFRSAEQRTYIFHCANASFFYSSWSLWTFMHKPLLYFFFLAMNGCKHFLCFLLNLLDNNKETVHVSLEKSRKAHLVLLVSKKGKITKKIRGSAVNCFNWAIQGVQNY